MLEGKRSPLILDDGPDGSRKLNGVTLSKGIDLKELFTQLPGWAWPLVALCLFIPVVTVGGALPVALGIAAALSCATTAKDTTRPPRTRVLLCVGITLFAWAGLAILLLLVARRH